ncbi:formate dehydrogenase accessory sulfurtransferase FdhD [candidate division CSSED10-310 bacterium]|uniref:Formate dehydrogenase accessory sulfurtransferase FdhD n=1 Tax=candidate division CSSED10-310 bacterium TaxID=2855610 RepID=A0ABV6Z614_UNCC1
MIKDLQQILTPIKSNFEIDFDAVFECLNKLSESQTHYQTTRGSHAALLFDQQREVISFAEDVGRHNALDKAIGKAFMSRKLPQARIAVLSSRISYELVQKAARAHLPMMLSHSRPTSLAVEMGKSLNITLAFPENESELIIVCGQNRIQKD